MPDEGLSSEVQDQREEEELERLLASDATIEGVGRMEVVEGVGEVLVLEEGNAEAGETSASGRFAARPPSTQGNERPSASNSGTKGKKRPWSKYNRADELSQVKVQVQLIIYKPLFLCCLR